jgi:hypothetical protein
MDLTLDDLSRLARTLELASLSDRERLMLREVFALAGAAIAGRGAGGPEMREGRAPELIALQPEPLTAPQGESLPPITEGFEGALRPGAAASFDLSRGSPARPESLRITARLV